MNEERARARQLRPPQARRSSLCPRAPPGNEKNVAWAAGDLLVVAARRRLRPRRLLSSVSRATNETLWRVREARESVVLASTL